MKNVLAEITRLRLERGWNEYELAKHCGLSSQQYQRGTEKIRHLQSKLWIKSAKDWASHYLSFLQRGVMQYHLPQNKRIC